MTAPTDVVTGASKARGLVRGMVRERTAAQLERIFAATEDIILRTGTDHISILDVCNSAKVSRGTFYRNFASLEELLEGYIRHRQEIFRRTLAERIATCTDPHGRFEALLEYLGSTLSSGRPRQLLLAAPDFALVVYKRLFRDATVRFQDLLAPVLDDWNLRLPDRDLLCELVIRMAMSEALVGGGPDPEATPRRVSRMLQILRLGRGPG